MSEQKDYIKEIERLKELFEKEREHTIIIGQRIQSALECINEWIECGYIDDAEDLLKILRGRNHEVP